MNEHTSTLNETVEQRIARSIAATQYESLPAEAVRATKEHILHTVSTVMAGSSAPGATELIEALREFGGRPDSTIIGWNVRVPPAHAAMANSTMGHAQDFDNNDDRIAYKSSVCAVPAALAVAEHLGATGRDVITATCIGIDLGIRMGLAVQPYPSHSQSPELGPFAAAATAAKLMGLDEEKIWNALGLAMCGVATVGVSTGGMTYSKRFEAGCAARNGVLAALIASKGFIARQPIFAGRNNFFRSVWKTDGDLDVLLADLGVKFEVVNVGPKPYPCCRWTHAPIDGALALMTKHAVKTDDIEEVRVTVGRRDFEVVFGGIDGVDARRQPRSIVDAQFSIPYTVAVAIIHRRVFLDDFTADAIRRSDVLALAGKVVPNLREEFDAWPANVKPCEIEIVTRQGQHFATRVEYARGNPRIPIPIEEIRENFLACAKRTPVPLSLERVLRAREQIENLELVEDAGAISRELSGVEF